MSINIKKILLFSILSLSVISCGTSESSSEPVIGELDVAVIQIGKSTVFRTTLKSVPELSKAKTYNLIGENNTTKPQHLGEQVNNYVLNQTTIPLEIYNDKGEKLISSVLNANDFKTQFSGKFNLDDNTIVDESKEMKSSKQNKSSFSAPSKSIIENNQKVNLTVDDLNIIATGVIDDLSTGTRSIQVPLICGSTHTGDLKPKLNQGFFIINDIMVEYNYAFDNPTEFNNLFTVKFIESNHKFENMKLYFRLPNTTNVVEALSGKILTQSEADSLFDTIVQAIDKNNPFQGTGIAYVDLTITPFGSLSLVQTKVTKVEGTCTIGAKSFTVRDGSTQPEPPKEINDIVDKNTDKKSLALYILGNEIEIRDLELNVCNEWMKANSGGAEGTYDRIDISDIPANATFDFRFEAFNIPDKFRVEYPASTVQFDSGWRGSQLPNTGEALSGQGYFEKFGLLTRGNSNTIVVMVTGEQSGTAWEYEIRCQEHN